MGCCVWRSVTRGGGRSGRPVGGGALFQRAAGEAIAVATRPARARAGAGGARGGGLRSEGGRGRGGGGGGGRGRGAGRERERVVRSAADLDRDLQEYMEE